MDKRDAYNMYGWAAAHPRRVVDPSHFWFFNFD